MPEPSWWDQFEPVKGMFGPKITHQDIELPNSQPSMGAITPPTAMERLLQTITDPTWKLREKVREYTNTPEDDLAPVDLLSLISLNPDVPDSPAGHLAELPPTITKSLGNLGEEVVAKAKKVGKGTTAAAASEVRLGKKASTRAQTIYDAIVGPNKGYSVNLQTGEVPSVGTMVGRHSNADPSRVHIIPLEDFTPEHIKRFVAENKDELGKAERHLGGWRETDPATGKEVVYLDSPQRVVDPTVTKKGVPAPDLAAQVRKATKIGEGKTALDPDRLTREAGSQKAIFTLDTMKEAKVNSWRSYIESVIPGGPNYGERFHEMAAKGDAWLQSQGGRAWWKLNGGLVSEVYQLDSPEKIKVMAGLLSSTSNRTTVAENIRHMSVYKQRLITGQPLIQPDFRLEGGQFYGRTKPIEMPFEVNRTPNLQRAAAGEYVSGPKMRDMQGALMDEPDPTTIDTHQVKLGEDPTRGIFMSRDPGRIEAEQYPIMKGEMQRHAREMGQTPAAYSAKAWAGIIREIQTTGQLYGVPYRLNASDALPLDQNFEKILEAVAKHHGHSVPRLIERLRAGDVNLMTMLLSTGIGAKLYADWRAKEDAAQPTLGTLGQ